MDRFRRQQPEDFTDSSVRSRWRQRGMTLIQMLAAVVILGVLLAVAIPLYGSTKKLSEKRGCEANMAAIFQAEEGYRVRNRAYTATLSNLSGTLGATPVCPSGSAAYTVTVSGSGAAQTITVRCNNSGAHVTGQYYGTTDGVTFSGM